MHREKHLEIASRYQHASGRVFVVRAARCASWVRGRSPPCRCSLFAFHFCFLHIGSCRQALQQFEERAHARACLLTQVPSSLSLRQVRQPAYHKASRNKTTEFIVFAHTTWLSWSSIIVVIITSSSIPSCPCMSLLLPARFAAKAVVHEWLMASMNAKQEDATWDVGVTFSPPAANHALKSLAAACFCISTPRTSALNAVIAN